jgi:hypothetical protein
MVDPDGDSFVRADRLVYVTRIGWDSSTRKATAMGVAAYDFDGGKRFHVVPHALASLALVYRGRAYVRLARQGGRSSWLTSLPAASSGREPQGSAGCSASRLRRSGGTVTRSSPAEGTFSAFRA